MAAKAQATAAASGGRKVKRKFPAITRDPTAARNPDGRRFSVTGPHNPRCLLVFVLFFPVGCFLIKKTGGPEKAPRGQCSPGARSGDWV